MISLLRCLSYCLISNCSLERLDSREFFYLVRKEMTAMTKPFVWLLDVDGVLNANKAGWSAAPLSGMAYYKGTGWRMRWSSALMTRIRQIHLAGSVEILWATSWCGYTDQLERLFRLPALGSAYSMGMDNETKLAAAEAVVESGRKLIWTDDEAVPLQGPSYDKFMAYGSLLIAPKSNKGLRPEHLDQIDNFTLGT